MISASELEKRFKEIKSKKIKAEEKLVSDALEKATEFPIFIYEKLSGGMLEELRGNGYTVGEEDNQRDGFTATIYGESK